MTRRWLTVGLAAFTLGAGLIVGATEDAGQRIKPLGTPGVVMHYLPPCASDDGPGPCRWDASKRGNGKGQSFIMTADGTVTHLEETQ